MTYDSPSLVYSLSANVNLLKKKNSREKTQYLKWKFHTLLVTYLLCPGENLSNVGRYNMLENASI